MTMHIWHVTATCVGLGYAWCIDIGVCVCLQQCERRGDAAELRVIGAAEAEHSGERSHAARAGGAEQEAGDERPHAATGNGHRPGPITTMDSNEEGLQRVIGGHFS